MRDLYMRLHDLEAGFECWQHPINDDLPRIWLDRQLLYLEDAIDAYAIEAIKNMSKGCSTFELCGVVCEVAVVHVLGEQALLVTDAEKLHPHRQASQSSPDQC